MSYSTNTIGLLVMSCDSYADLWPVYFDSFFKHWPDCPFKIYLGSNTLSFSHPRVTTLLSGSHVSWSTTLRYAIDQMPETNVLCMLDDIFLIGPVDTGQIMKLCDWFIAYHVNYLRFHNSPRPNHMVSKALQIGSLASNACYRISSRSSLWCKKTLAEVLRDTENIWQFEIFGTERSALLPHFYGVYQDQFEFTHGVSRGRWLWRGLRDLQRQGYNIDLQKRSKISGVYLARQILQDFNGLLVQQLPSSWRQSVIKMQRRIISSL